jgi:hypothetical protein
MSHTHGISSVDTEYHTWNNTECLVERLPQLLALELWADGAGVDALGEVVGTVVAVVVAVVAGVAGVAVAADEVAAGEFAAVVDAFGAAAAGLDPALTDMYPTISIKPVAPAAPASRRARLAGCGRRFRTGAC